MPEDDDNVVPFPRPAWEQTANAREAERDEAPLRLRRPGKEKTCEHRNSWVDVQARRLHCRDCGVELDPYTVLAQIADRRESLIRRAQHYRGEISRLQERVDALTKAEKNAKARIRGARRRRDDRDALIAAASVVPEHQVVAVRIGGYQPWEKLGEGQREVVLGYVRLMIEAYHGALDTVAGISA